MFWQERVFTNEYTKTIQKLIREIVSDPSTYMGQKYLPSVALPVSEVVTEIIEANGGLVNEHLPGTQPKYVQSFGTRQQKYSPPMYKEAIHYDEKKLLWLRQLGENDQAVRGIRQYIDQDVDRLNRRVEARIEKQRWDVIFNGGFSWMGSTISFGVPGANRATPIGQNWSTDGIAANGSADPIKDLRYWLMGGLSAFRKYVVTKIVMNPNTSRFLLDNANVRSYVTSFGANPSINDFDLNKVLQFLIPGLPPVEIYRGWWQDESVVSGRLVAGDAQYFIPDGYIFFETSLPGGDAIGEFMQTIHLASGTVDSPGFGKFMVVDDNTAPGTKGGPANPYIDLVSGVYGGVKLDRAFDLLTAKVVP